MTELGKKWTLEFVWWITAAVIALILLLPILLANIEFPWFRYNAIYIIAAIMLIRYIVSLEHHPLARSKAFKIIMILIVPLLFFPILEGLHSFLEYNDQQGLQTFMDHMKPADQRRLMTYIRIEYVLAGVTCFIGVFAMILKMIRSLWRQIKYNQV